VLLYRADLRVRRVQRHRDVLVHATRIIAGHDTRRIAVPTQQRQQIFLGHASEHGRAGDLVLVEVKDRKHGTIARRIEKPDPLPRALQGSSLRLAVADHARDEQVRVVERGAEGVHERVAKLAALVNRSRRRHADVARDAARRGELPHERQEAGFVGGHVRIDLRIGALEIDVRNDRRPAMTLVQRRGAPVDPSRRSAG